MNLSVVIPARLASTRFPRKVLADLGGKSVLQRVWEQVQCMEFPLVQVLIATDAQEVAEHASSFGARVLMSSPDCVNGTARIASVLGEIEGDFILNVQGDEPFISPALLDSLARKAQSSQCDVVTAVYPLHDSEQVHNPNLVKVARACNGQALYFSRSPVPYVRDSAQETWAQAHPYWGHIGVYGYSRALLAQYDSLEPTALETAERLEQLRFLEHGFSIQTVETEHNTPGIDTPHDLQTALAYLGQAPS